MKKFLIALVFVVFSIPMFSTPTFADRGDRGGWSQQHRGGGWNRGRGGGGGWGNRRSDDIVGGIIGGAIGGVIGGWLTRPAPEVVVVPAPRPSAGVVLEPFTPDWYSYCGNKYNSFDPKTGMYTTFEGNRRFCQ